MCQRQCWVLCLHCLLYCPQLLKEEGFAEDEETEALRKKLFTQSRPVAGRVEVQSHICSKRQILAPHFNVSLTCVKTE